MSIEIIPTGAALGAYTPCLRKSARPSRQAAADRSFLAAEEVGRTTQTASATEMSKLIGISRRLRAGTVSMASLDAEHVARPLMLCGGSPRNPARIPRSLIGTAALGLGDWWTRCPTSRSFAQAGNLSDDTAAPVVGRTHNLSCPGHPLNRKVVENQRILPCSKRGPRSPRTPRLKQSTVGCAKNVLKVVLPEKC